MNVIQQPHAAPVKPVKYPEIECLSRHDMSLSLSGTALLNQWHQKFLLTGLTFRRNVETSKLKYLLACLAKIPLGLSPK